MNTERTLPEMLTGLVNAEITRLSAALAAANEKIERLREQNHSYVTDCAEQEGQITEHAAREAVLMGALKRIADTRYSERDEPFDDALDIADKALASAQASAMIEVVKAADTLVGPKGETKPFTMREWEALCESVYRLRATKEAG